MLAAVLITVRRWHTACIVSQRRSETTALLGYSDGRLGILGRRSLRGAYMRRAVFFYLDLLSSSDCGRQFMDVGNRHVELTPVPFTVVRRLCMCGMRCVG